MFTFNVVSYKLWAIFLGNTLNITEPLALPQSVTVTVSGSACLSPERRRGPRDTIRCKNLALYIRDCESLCLSDDTLKAVGPFYLVSMPGEVKDPTQGVNV